MAAAVASIGAMMTMIAFRAYTAGQL